VSPAAGNCPRPEEFSALLDWELAPERLPALERHIEECERCRGHYTRLAAADRMLGLVLGEVHLLAECLAVGPEEKDAPPAELVAELESAGREERLAALRKIAIAQARRRRKLLIAALALLLLAGGGLAGALQPSPIKALSGGAVRNGSYVAAIEAGTVTLCDGTEVRLESGTIAGFRCAWRWERPWAEWIHGRLKVESCAGKLRVMANGQAEELAPGQSFPKN